VSRLGEHGAVQPPDRPGADHRDAHGFRVYYRLPRDGACNRPWVALP
jgi:hypothetical protein